MTRHPKIPKKTIYTTFFDLHQYAIQHPTQAPQIYMQMKQIVQKTKIRIPETIKKQYCNKCGNLLRYENIRIKAKKPVYNCPICSHHFTIQKKTYENIQEKSNS